MIYSEEPEPIGDLPINKGGCLILTAFVVLFWAVVLLNWIYG
jgi:hypothetical protein